ncbi:MAG: nucleotidyltransferase family protein [Bacteroidota bacterium]
MISAIVVAAGKSSRTGDTNKLMLPFGDSTILGTVIYNLTKSDVDEIVLVLQPDNELENSINDTEKIKITYNDSPQDGLTSSIQLGIEKANPDNACLVCLADMPLIKANDYNLLINRLLNDNSKVIITPFKDGITGNPVLFSNHFRADILELKQMNGCKPVLTANHHYLKKIDVESDAYFTDIDTLDQYKNLFWS